MIGQMRRLRVTNNLTGAGPIRIPVLARHLLLFQTEALAAIHKQLQPGRFLGNQMAGQVFGPNLLVGAGMRDRQLSKTMTCGGSAYCFRSIGFVNLPTGYAEREKIIV